MKSFVKTIYFIFATLILVYVFLPNINFPNVPDNFIKSYEPADVEDGGRQGFYTNFDRSEVIKYFSQNFGLSFFNLFKIKPFLLLNYPPEDSQLLIRDQTRSTYLQELVFPFRESLFINGFVPKEDKDSIVVGGERFSQKTIIKLNQSNLSIRILIMSSALFAGYYIVFLFLTSIENFSISAHKLFKLWIQK